MTRKKSNKKESAVTHNYAYTCRAELLSNILAIGSCGLYAPLFDVEDDLKVNDLSVKVIIDEGRVMRSKLSLAIDSYINALRQFISQSQSIETEKDEHIKTLQKVEVQAQMLRNLMDCLNNLGCNERQILLGLRLRFDCNMAAADYMYSRFIIVQHLRQKKFEKHACNHISHILFAQYDIKNLYDNAIYELQNYADSIRRRLHIDKVELEKIKEYLINYSSPVGDQADNVGDEMVNSSICFNTSRKHNSPNNDDLENIQNQNEIINMLTIAYHEGVGACITKFLSSDIDHLDDIMILVSGNDGSGKTYLCETISRLSLEASVEGMFP